MEIAALASQAMGQKQLAAPAPPVQAPQPQGMSLFSPQEELERELGDLSLLGSAATSNPTGVEPQAPEPVGPPEAIPTGVIPEVGPPEERAGNGGFFGDLFGSMDNSLQSPSKLIGIGLLNQRNPGLGTGLLAAGGLYSALRKRRQRRNG